MIAALLSTVAECFGWLYRVCTISPSQHTVNSCSHEEVEIIVEIEEGDRA